MPISRWDAVQAKKRRANIAKDPPHLCHALDCSKVVAPKLLMCAQHWAMVPKALQRRVWDTFMPGQEITKTPTPEYLEAALAAVDAVADIERGLRQRLNKRQGELF